MGIITWLIFGALVGWVASIIMKRNSEMGAVSNVVVGIIGAGLGGWIATLLGIGTISGFNFYSLLIALAGACLLLLVIGLVQRATKTEKH